MEKWHSLLAVFHRRGGRGVESVTCDSPGEDIVADPNAELVFSGIVLAAFLFLLGITAFAGVLAQSH